MINSNNIYEKVSIPLTEEFIKKVVINFITMTINCDKYVPQFPNNFEPYKTFYHFLKDDINKGNSIYDSIIELNNKIERNSIENDVYNPLIENGNSFSPITANQLGWYSYQSWHLSNDKRYNKGDISHRFYISVDSSVIPEFIVLLKEKFEKMDMSYYFKVNNASVVGNTQKDGIVIYSSTNDLNNTLLILEEIENEYPGIVKKCNEPHLFCGNINGWIGYANEVKNQKNSYTNLMAQIMYDSIETSVLNWVKVHDKLTIDSDGKNINLLQYFNSAMLSNSTTKTDYVIYIKRLGHLVNIIPKYDLNFKPELYRIIRNNLIKNNIDPNNICFNFDVLGEISKYNSNLIQNKVAINDSEDNGIKM